MSLPYTLKWIIPFRDYFIRGLQTLPLTIAGLAWFFSITTASFTFMMYALVMTIVIPGIVGLLQWVLRFSFFAYTDPTSKFFSNLEKAANCNLVFGNNASLQVLPSYWLTSVIFFFATILGNAIVNYTKPQGPYASDMGYLRRRIQSIFAIISIVIIFFITIGFRLISGCEGKSAGVSALTLLISSSIAITLAWNITSASKEYSLDIFNMFLYDANCNKGSIVPCAYITQSISNPDLLNQLQDDLINNTTLLQKMNTNLTAYINKFTGNTVAQDVSADKTKLKEKNFKENIANLITTCSSYNVNTLVSYFKNNVTAIDTLNTSIQNTPSMTDTGINSFINQIKEVSKNLNATVRSIAKQEV